MKKITTEIMEEKDDLLLYIHTPFCGTCHVARSFLETIESTLQKQVFYEMNASLYPGFMQAEKIESVPCLLIVRAGEVKEKVYTFHSIANIYHYLLRYAPYLFEAK